MSLPFASHLIPRDRTGANLSALLAGTLVAASLVALALAIAAAAPWGAAREPDLLSSTEASPDTCWQHGGFDRSCRRSFDLY
mgnify:CR=1 FL=1|jgi:Spy/CpxP family protein refolding chaperone